MQTELSNQIKNPMRNPKEKCNTAFDLWVEGCHSPADMAAELDAIYPKDKPHNRGTTYRWITLFSNSYPNNQILTKIKHIKGNRNKENKPISKAPLRQAQGKAKAPLRQAQGEAKEICHATTTQTAKEHTELKPVRTEQTQIETNNLQQQTQAKEATKATPAKKIVMAFVTLFLVLISFSEYYIHKEFFHIFLGKNNATVPWAIAIAAYPLFMVTLRFLLPADWYYDAQARTTLFFLALFEFASVYVVSYINFLKANRIISIRHLTIIDGNEAWFALVPALLFALMMYGTTAYIFKTMND